MRANEVKHEGKRKREGGRKGRRRTQYRSSVRVRAPAGPLTCLAWGYDESMTALEGKREKAAGREGPCIAWLFVGSSIYRMLGRPCKSARSKEAKLSLSLSPSLLLSLSACRCPIYRGRLKGGL